MSKQNCLSGTATLAVSGGMYNPAAPLRTADAKRHRRLPWIWLLGLLGCVVSSDSGLAQSRNLGVYSLTRYEDRWKSSCIVDPDKDPAVSFWSTMTTPRWMMTLNTAYLVSANPTWSRRYTNADVALSSVLPIPGSSYMCWDDFSLVFFFGHNNMITPPHPNDSFDNHNALDDFCPTVVNPANWTDWGTPAAPYDYWAIRHQTAGRSRPAAVTYLYNKYTSSLLGEGYDYCVSSGSSLWKRVHCNDPLQQTNGSRALGDHTLKCLILAGCQAVITANEGDGSYTNVGVRAFAPTHGGWHLILGHYKPYYASQVKPLDPFAWNLLCSVPLQTAWFDQDPDQNSSAIGAESNHSLTTVKFFWTNSTMANERWWSPRTDTPHEPFLGYSTRWIVDWYTLSRRPSRVRFQGIESSGKSSPISSILGASRPPRDFQWETGWKTRMNNSPANPDKLNSLGAFPSPGPEESCTYEVTPLLQYVEAVAGTNLVSVTTATNCAWTAGTDTPWLHFTSPTNVLGPGVVGYHADLNLSGTARTGALSVAGCTVTVVQWGTNCQYDLSPTSIVCGVEAQSRQINIASPSNCPWWFYTTNGWLTITEPTNGVGPGTLGFRVAANTGPSARVGTIMLDHIPGAVVSVTQAGDCAYAVTPSLHYFEFFGGTNQVSVATATNCPWVAATSNSWLHFDSPTNMTGPGLLEFRADLNASPIARTGYVSIANCPFDCTPQLVTVVQWGTNCQYVLSPSSATFGPGGGTGLVSVATGSTCPWSCSNLVNWIYADPTVHVGMATSPFAVTPNLSQFWRTGYISVASQLFTVYQAPDPLTMDTIPIQSAEARALLNTDTLPFRQIQTTYLPTNPVPVLTLESISDDLCRQRLTNAVGELFLDHIPSATWANLMTTMDNGTNDADNVGWIDRYSGSFSFTRTTNSMGTPTRFADYQEPIQVALSFVATNALLDPMPGEQVDLLSVSAVQNAFVNADSLDTATNQFRSDYYVVFGRRFQNVPIIGSELVLRLDGNGEAAMVRKHWRRIIQAGPAMAVPTTNSLPQLIMQNPRFYPEFGTNVSLGDLYLADFKCGYFEAPMSYRQPELRLGGSVSFKVGTNSTENLAQMTVPLEDNLSQSQLLGRKYWPSYLAVLGCSATNCTLSLVTDSGYNYDLQVSTNLTSWTACGTLSNVVGSATFVDTQVSGYSARFYRAVEKLGSP